MWRCFKAEKLDYLRSISIGIGKYNGSLLTCKDISTGKNYFHNAQHPFNLFVYGVFLSPFHRWGLFEPSWLSLSSLVNKVSVPFAWKPCAALKVLFMMSPFGACQAPCVVFQLLYSFFKLLQCVIAIGSEGLYGELCSPDGCRKGYYCRKSPFAFMF